MGFLPPDPRGGCSPVHMGQVLVYGCRAQALPQEAPRVAAQARPGGRARPLPAEAGLVLPLGQRDRHIVAPPGSGLGSRCTVGLRHLVMRRWRPRELWLLSASQGGWRAGAHRVIWYVCAWGHGSYGVTRAGRRRGCAVSELAPGRRAVASRHALCSAASRLLSSACKFVHERPVCRGISSWFILK